MSEQKQFPIQKTTPHRHDHHCVPESVYMAAYEVYSHCYGKQEALIKDGCRGGFGQGELVAFLYAKSFPKNEWRDRVDEAFKGMQL